MQADYTAGQNINQDELPSLGVITPGFDPSVTVSPVIKSIQPGIQKPNQSAHVYDAETPTLGAPVPQSTGLLSAVQPRQQTFDIVKNVKPATISGIVKKISGEPLADAFLIIKDSKDILVKVLITNSGGIFSSILRTPGIYHIEVRSDGGNFEPISLNLVNSSDYNFEVVSIN